MIGIYPMSFWNRPFKIHVLLGEICSSRCIWGFLTNQKAKATFSTIVFCMVYRSLMLNLSEFFLSYMLCTTREGKFDYCCADFLFDVNIY